MPIYKHLRSKCAFVKLLKCLKMHVSCEIIFWNMHTFKFVYTTTLAVPQACEKCWRHFHCWWGPGGLWQGGHPLLGLPATGRRFCTRYCYNGKTYWKWPSNVMCDHHQKGCRKLHVIWNGVLQHSEEKKHKQTKKPYCVKYRLRLKQQQPI